MRAAEAILGALTAVLVLTAPVIWVALGHWIWKGYWPGMDFWLQGLAIYWAIIVVVLLIAVIVDPRR